MQSYRDIKRGIIKSDAKVTQKAPKTLIHQLVKVLLISIKIKPGTLLICVPGFLCPTVVPLRTRLVGLIFVFFYFSFCFATFFGWRTIRIQISMLFFPFNLTLYSSIGCTVWVTACSMILAW